MLPCKTRIIVDGNGEDDEEIMLVFRTHNWRDVALTEIYGVKWPKVDLRQAHEERKGKP